MANIDFIEIYEDSASQELCDGLVNWFDLCSDRGFTCYNMPFNDGKQSNRLRSDEATTIPDASRPVSSLSIPGAISDAFWDVLNKCYDHYIKKYDLDYLRLSSHIFKLHKVKEGQGYHSWHSEADNVRSFHRILAWMTYLKVPEEGGETEFLHQSKRIVPAVGKTLIWPAYFTHLHRGNPPLKGEKYYITGWFEGV